MKPSDIKTAEPFESLFPVDAAVVSRVVDDMRVNGYDPSAPVVVWKERGIVVDGHTRIMAAMTVGIAEIPIVEKSFADEGAAVAYAIHAQRDRRNLTDADILRWTEELRVRHSRGRPMENGSTEPITGPEKERIAGIIGTSASKIQKAMAVSDHASEETKTAVRTGKKSLNAAVSEGKPKKAAAQTAQAAPVPKGDLAEVMKQEVEAFINGVAQKYPKDLFPAIGEVFRREALILDNLSYSPPEQASRNAQATMQKERLWLQKAIEGATRRWPSKHYPELVRVLHKFADAILAARNDHANRLRYVGPGSVERHDRR